MGVEWYSRCEQLQLNRTRRKKTSHNTLTKNENCARASLGFVFKRCQRISIAIPVFVLHSDKVFALLTGCLAVPHWLTKIFLFSSILQKVCEIFVTALLPYAFGVRCACVYHPCTARLVVSIVPIGSPNVYRGNNNYRLQVTPVTSIQPL